MLTIIIFALAFLRSVHLQRTPTISYISPEQIKDIGGTVEFACSVQYSNDYPVLWIKSNKNGDDQLPISTNAALIIRDSRFSLRTDPSASTYTLQIKDIQENDAGIYHCRILISTSHKISDEVGLQVRRAPLISDHSTRSVVVSEGQSAQLECSATGFPTPRISWRRENNAILPTGGSIYRGNTLKLSAVGKEDRGTYYCVAENGVGRGARRSISLEVEFSPVITIPRPRVGQAVGHDINLECHVESYPPPTISWHKKEVHLSNNRFYGISYFAAVAEYTESTLKVKKVQPKQFGEFICKAANKLGVAEAPVELYETSAPQCPPSCAP